MASPNFLSVLLSTSYKNKTEQKITPVYFSLTDVSTDIQFFHCLFKTAISIFPCCASLQKPF